MLGGVRPHFSFLTLPQLLAPSPIRPELVVVTAQLLELSRVGIDWTVSGSSCYYYDNNTMNHHRHQYLSRNNVCVCVRVYEKCDADAYIEELVEMLID